jgi:hypothetical protein
MIDGDEYLIIIRWIDAMNHLVDLFENKNYEEVTIPAMDANDNPGFPRFRQPRNEKNQTYDEGVDNDESRPRSDTRGKNKIQQRQKKQECDTYQIDGRKQKEETSDSHEDGY